MSWLPRLDQVAGHLPWFIAAYFAAQVVIRVLISPSLGQDEAEQALLTQAMAWGYGPQPPLYTWLATFFFGVFGKGVFALSLLKNLLLAASYLLTYAIARRISGDRLVAAAAAASLMLIPQIAWESQRALTHTNLVLFAVALFTYALVRVLEHGQLRSYALLGVAFACGVLAKFNFPIIAVAMLLAALSMPAFRGRLLNPGILLSAAIVGLLLWRPLLWVYANQAATLQRAGKLTGVQADSPLMNAASGLWNLFFGSLLYLAPVLVVFGLLLVRATGGRTAGPDEKAFVTLLMRSIVIALAACVPMIIAFEVTQIKERWLQPLLYGAPIAIALWCSRRLARGRLAAVVAVAVVCAFLVIVMVPMRTVVAPSFGRTNSLNSPYSAFATQIRAAGFEKGAILASFNLLGGNLSLQFPTSVVVTPEYPNFAPPDGGPYLLVWEATRDTRMPDKIAVLYEQTTGRKLPATQPQYLSADMLYSETEQMRLGILLLR